jgi:hypothetical protein
VNAPAGVTNAEASLAAEIRAYLDARRSALCAEIDHYPTPIARCDVQLTALIEARDVVMRLLRSTDDATLVQAFAAAGCGDDEDAWRLWHAARRTDGVSHSTP